MIFLSDVKYEHPLSVTVRNPFLLNFIDDDRNISHKSEGKVFALDDENYELTFDTAELKDDFVFTEIVHNVARLREVINLNGGIKRTKSGLLKEYEKQKQKW